MAVAKNVAVTASTGASSSLVRRCGRWLAVGVRGRCVVGSQDRDEPIRRHDVRAFDPPGSLEPAGWSSIAATTAATSGANTGARGWVPGPQTNGGVVVAPCTVA